MERAGSNNIVLSYYNCLLRTTDVNLLRGPHWLNDVLIGFYFEYLDEKFNNPGREKLLFVSPELTQLLKMTDPLHYDIFLAPIHALNSSFIFFPLNNCDRKDAAGGTHWSLLVYSRVERTCFHFDSSRGFNTSVALEFSRNIMTYLLNEEERRFVEADCPQQDNGYDCGLFVLCLTDVISEHAIQYSKIASCEYSGVQDLVKQKRSRMIDLIDSLKCRPDRIK